MVGAQPPRPIHHQARIAGDGRDYRSVAALGIRRTLLHCNARGERRLAVGAGCSEEASCIIRFPGEEERINAIVIIGASEACAIASPDRLLVCRAKVGGPPGLPRRIQRLSHLCAGGIRVRQPGPAISRFRLVGREEGEGCRSILARLHRLFGPAAHPRCVGPIGVGNQECRIIRKAIAVALAQCPPGLQRRRNALVCAIGAGSGARHRILCRARGCGGQQHRDDHSDTPHAGHFAVPLLISQ